MVKQNTKSHRAIFTKAVDFSDATFNEAVYFSSATFIKAVDFSDAVFHGRADFDSTIFNYGADFSYSEFIDEVEFDKSYFPSPKADKDLNAIETYELLIRFDYRKFRKLVQFRGTTSTPLELGRVSFIDVDLSNVEFHNVEWQKTKELIFITRNVIVDEKMLDVYHNYEEVSKIYNQLRKNYESRLLFNEASHFFVGEMEAIRKSLLDKGRIIGRLLSAPYSMYKWMALYGESALLPLAVWTPIALGAFFMLRLWIIHKCSQNPCHNIIDQFVDSFAAYFQIPRSQHSVDIVERVVSAPILGSAFIAVRRRFERTK